MEVQINDNICSNCAYYTEGSCGLADGLGKSQDDNLCYNFIKTPTRAIYDCSDDIYPDEPRFISKQMMQMFISKGYDINRKLFPFNPQTGEKKETVVISRENANSPLIEPTHHEVQQWLWSKYGIAISVFPRKKDNQDSYMTAYISKKIKDKQILLPEFIDGKTTEETLNNAYEFILEKVI